MDVPKDGRPARRREPRWPLLLLLIPFVALLYPPWYAHFDPALGGVPFFVWYQFLWVVLAAILTALAYRFRRF
jgi:uncharacterized protein DUF3311